MKYTSAEANKLLKKLNDEYAALLDREKRSREFRAARAKTSSQFVRPITTMRRSSGLQKWSRLSAA